MQLFFICWSNKHIVTKCSKPCQNTGCPQVSENTGCSFHVFALLQEQRSVQDSWHEFQQLQVWSDIKRVKEKILRVESEQCFSILATDVGKLLCSRGLSCCECYQRHRRDRIIYIENGEL